MDGCVLNPGGASTERLAKAAVQGAGDMVLSEPAGPEKESEPAGPEKES